MNGIFDKTLSTVFKIDNQDTENTENVSDNKIVDNVLHILQTFAGKNRCDK